jgi:predicted flavoprotein YhiN
LHGLGIEVAPLVPANCGWEITWSPELLARAEGLPLKNIAARAGEQEVAGELMITRYGLEGGAIYQLGHALRQQAEPVLEIDFKPSFTHEQLTAKLSGVKTNWWQAAQQRWRLSPAAVALLEELGAAELDVGINQLAHLVKKARVQLNGPRPLAEAISTAGGVRSSEITEELMLLRYPGLFVAGEMMDWEAPTGGYLLQGAFATGGRAGVAAARYIAQRG